MPITYTVCIIDDDPDMLELVRARVSTAPRFNCIGSFEKSETALKELPQLKPDIVLMDINMPGVNGIECVQQLKLKLPDSCFIMLTVYEDTNHIFDALTAGAIGYLVKRDVGKKLIASLDDAIQGGSPMDRSIARRVVQSFQSAPKLSSPLKEKLSEREQEVLNMMAQGMSRKMVADKLGLSINTVDCYTRRTYEKLQVNSRAEAIAKLSK